MFVQGGVGPQSGPVETTAGWVSAALGSFVMDQKKPYCEALNLFGSAARQYQHPFPRERPFRCRFGTLPHETGGIVLLSVQNCGRAKFRRGRIGPLRRALDEVFSALCVPLYQEGRGLVTLFLNVK
jgi:hypothetical protein